MASKPKIFVVSHMDVDGVVSYMVLKWYFGRDLDVMFTTPQKFGDEFALWSKENFDKYDKIFILDLDVSENQELVDFDKVVVVDHHTTNDADYKNAKTKIEECTSAARLAYQMFSKLPNANFTRAQKALIAMADDYDSYTLKIPQSKELNILLFESQRKPFNFIEDFKDGYVGFNETQKNTITLHKRKLHKILDELKTFHNNIKIQDKLRHVVAGFASECINEVAEYLIKTYEADLAIVVNLSSGHVSFRKDNDKNEDLDVSKVAQTLCEGGGRAETAGGTITEAFQHFTKRLVPM
jgi:oligoribonuclease NrnB/cAMP/cGMP phosphodiesterase (DHH superfamily)